MAFKFTKLHIGNAATTVGGFAFKRLMKESAGNEETEEQLTAPILTLDGDILTITDESGLAEEFDILVDGVVTKTVAVGSGESGGGETPDTPEITDLTNTTWNVPSGWTATAGYGKFDIQGTFTFVYDEYGETTRTNLSNFYIGYAIIVGGVEERADSVYYKFGAGSSYHLNSTSFTLKITGGADVTNTKLIEWLLANGTMV